jgi:UDP-N-acetylmuramate: L-alanyl-gamma-D-glutamyl-meso-diaminopimelate ligase
MHIHIIGICGTFMGSLALLARDMGMKVTGCDMSVYPPMSDQLNNVDIKLIEGFDTDQLGIKPDLWVIGNIATRGLPIIESILNEKLPFISGPSFLSNYILKNHDVIAVSGTHGKTTVSSLLAWIFEFSNYDPGFLIGGLPQNFGKSARNGKKDGVFIVEADEYDTAFFDKRSKFLHYTPKVAIINNLEFDHADIFSDLSAIEDQFHNWLKTIPSKSKIIVNKADDSLVKLVERGIWSNFQFFNERGNWAYKNLVQPNHISKINDNSGQSFEKFIICDDNNHELEIFSPLLGEHNKSNIVAAAAAAKSMGISIEQTAEAIKNFKGIKRRMELRGDVQGIKVFDDFAHHPTAIKTTILGAKKNL